MKAQAVFTFMWPVVLLTTAGAIHVQQGDRMSRMEAKMKSASAALASLSANLSSTYTSIGCWNNCPRVWSTSASIGRPHNSVSCGALAEAGGYKFFSVEDGNHCWLHTETSIISRPSDFSTCADGGSSCVTHVYQVCSDVTARAEGCDQPSRGTSCGCGCAIVTGMGSGDATYSHASNYRGIMVSTSAGHNFFSYTDLTSLKNHLNGIAAGTVVAVATNDEPFFHWYENSGNIGTDLNNILVSMGMPAPNGGTLSSDMFRASYAGVGQAGCGSSCPTWTGSVYTARYADVAIVLLFVHRRRPRRRPRRLTRRPSRRPTRRPTRRPSRRPTRRPPRRPTRRLIRHLFRQLFRRPARHPARRTLRGGRRQTRRFLLELPWRVEPEAWLRLAIPT
ncbi:unnamed protein product [Prorocentrum cordatum]|uniref:Subtilisin n=1 Tax=Prorocentrum cordatum TaxID=2364126 RepID=A0ABN9SJK4_9DINO|nr:unnamed protein product [Polarella glacialis]